MHSYESCRSETFCALWTLLLLDTSLSMLLDLPWLPLLSFALIFMIAPCLSPFPRLPSYYLPVHLALRQSIDRICYIRFLFKTTGTVERSCSWSHSSVLIHFFFFFFLQACHFTILPFLTLLSKRRGLIGITSVLFRLDFFLCMLLKLFIEIPLFCEYMYLKLFSGHC